MKNYAMNATVSYRPMLEVFCETATQQGLTLAELSRRSGLSVRKLRGRLEGRTTLKVVDILVLARALDLSLAEGQPLHAAMQASS